MSSGFVSEKELADARIKRQEEWEKVRTAEQPLEAPEETYDARSLFERLEEQRRKRDLDFEESRKLKNMVKGLDDDEVDFLDLVDQKKMEAERNKTRDEERELLDYRNRVANLQEQSLEQRLHAEIQNVKKPTNPPPQRNNRLSQNQLLKGGLVIKKPDNALKKRRNAGDIETPKKPKLNNENVENNENSKNSIDDADENCQNENISFTGNIMKTEDTFSSPDIEKTLDVAPQSSQGPVQKCIGVLPGLGYYSDDSSSESDSGSSDVEDVVFGKPLFDLCGRKIEDKLKTSS